MLISESVRLSSQRTSRGTVASLYQKRYEYSTYINAFGKSTRASEPTQTEGVIGIAYLLPFLLLLELGHLDFLRAEEGLERR